MSSESILERIEQEAKKALVQNAFFRWESAVLIAGTILLSVFFKPFPIWPWWGWPLLGLVSEAAVVYSSLTDKAELQKVMDSLFREKYSTGGIRDRDLRQRLDEAEEYRERIQEVLKQQRNGPIRDRLSDTTGQVYDWIANMVALARSLDSYRSDSIIQRDRQEVPKEVRSLDARMKLESNERVVQQMASTLASKRQQAESLAELDARMTRADLQIEHSLAALGTVYSQLLLVGSKDVDSDRTERLRDDIRNEVLALQDLVVSLNEVYTSSSGTGTKESTTETRSTERRQAAAR